MDIDLKGCLNKIQQEHRTGECGAGKAEETLHFLSPLELALQQAEISASVMF